jgi:cation transport regulator ChaB
MIGNHFAMPKKGPKGEYVELPSTLARSPKKAQDTYEETLEHAEQEYGGDEARAHRVAWASVKHSFEKVGDRWEAKATRGPSDERAREGGQNPSGRSYGGVDVEGKSKAELASEARALGVHVTTHMTKAELGESIERANDAATRRARDSS